MTRWMNCILVAAIGSLAGCQSGGEQVEESTPEQEWGTKEYSVLARETTAPQLSVPRALRDQDAHEYRRTAVALLLQAANSSSPLLRAHAIEALQPSPSDLEPIVRLSLADGNRGVRFVAAMMVGRMKLTALADLVEPLLDDESPSVRAAAIYALRQCGEVVNPSPLAEMLYSGDPEVKGNAAMVLGELGDATAIPMLRNAARIRPVRTSAARNRIVELQIAEAIVKLGDDQELEVIRAALFAPSEQGELSALAAEMCGRLGDVAYLGALTDMAVRTGSKQESAEIRLAAVQAIARIDRALAPTDVALAYLGSEQYLLRAQAAIALGWIGDESTIISLVPLMRDSEPIVQVAAASAVVRITAP